MRPDKPVLLKVGSQGAYVNLNNVISLSIVKDMAHQQLKEGVKLSKEKPQPGEEDIEIVHNDTIMFYFSSESELAFRKGKELTEAEYEELARLINSIVYHDGSPVQKTASEGTK